MHVRGWGQGKEYTQEGHFTSFGSKLASRSGVEAKIRAELWKEALLWEGILSKNLGVACGFFRRLEEQGLVEDSVRSGGSGWRGCWSWSPLWGQWRITARCFRHSCGHIVFQKSHAGCSVDMVAAWPESVVGGRKRLDLGDIEETEWLDLATGWCGGWESGLSGRTSRFWSEPTVTSFTRIRVQEELWEGRGGLSFLTYRIECKYHQLITLQECSLSESYTCRVCTYRTWEWTVCPGCPLTSPDLSGGGFSQWEFWAGGRDLSVVNRCRARERVEREKGNGLSAEHPGSHPLSWGGERKRRTRGKRRRTSQRKSRCDRRVWVMKPREDGSSQRRLGSTASSMGNLDASWQVL